jgi:hypothetical protein
MTQQDDRALDQAREENEGFFRSLYGELRLIARLLKDPRVSFWLKILPIGALIYLFSPLDISPINPLDDGLVLWLGGYFFIELCPDDVVEEHRKALRTPISKDSTVSESPPDVVEGSFREVPGDQDQ